VTAELEEQLQAAIVNTEGLPQALDEGDAMVLIGHEERVRPSCVLLLPEYRLASGGEDCVVRIWELQQGRCLALLRDTQQQAHWIRCITPLRGRLLVAKGLQITLWQLPAPQEDDSAAMETMQLAQPERILSGHTGIVFDISSEARLPGCQHSIVASASHDRTVRLWIPALAECLQVLNHTDSVHSAHWLPCPGSDAILLVATLATGEVMVRQSAEATIEPEPKLHLRKWRRLINCAHAQPGRLALGLQDSSVRIIRLPQGDTQCVMRASAGWVQVVMLHGEHLAAGTDDGSVTIWGLEHPCEVQHICQYQPHSESISCLGIYGRFLVTGSDDGTICLTQFGPQSPSKQIASELQYLSCCGHHQTSRCAL